MTGLCGCLIRRIAGLVGVLVAVALIAAPVALANGDTITATKGVQFSGIVDNGRVCAATATAISIHWGDGTGTSPGDLRHRPRIVSGTHTYATGGTFNGTVTSHGGN